LELIAQSCSSKEIPELDYARLHYSWIISGLRQFLESDIHRIAIIDIPHPGVSLADQIPTILNEIKGNPSALVC